MSTIHKCDKCGKIIKGNRVDFSFSDRERKIFENYYNSFDFCDICVKPLAVYLRGFLKISKNIK